MKRSLIKLCIIAALTLSSSAAFALDLQSARASGALGEKNDGYVEVLAPSAEASALASTVNAGRKAEYARISKENGQPLDVVGKVAAGTIKSKLPAGSMLQDAAGNWVKK